MKIRDIIETLVIGAVLALSWFNIARAEQRYTPVVDKSMPSVVKIIARYVDFDVDPKTKKITPHFYGSSGSGVIVSTNGHILTCEHVVDGHPIILQVQLYGSTSTYITATVLRRSVDKDIALLRLVNYSTPTVPVRLAAEEPKVGDEVVAIGHPLGYDWSASAGIISGLNREGLAVNLLQTDAAINPGNSGGPLFDLQGYVVGLNESKIPNASNMGFAVSVRQVRDFLEVFKGLEQAF